MSIENILSQATALAVKELYGADVEPQSIVPQATRKEFEGNLTIVVFPFLKASRKAPDATAQEIGTYLTAHCDAVEKFNVIKGFLNISIKPSFWAQVLDDICRDENYGFTPETAQSQLVMMLRKPLITLNFSTASQWAVK